MSADPLDDLPPDVRASVERFRTARSRIMMAMLSTPLLAHQVAERRQLLEDLATVRAFLAAIDVAHAEANHLPAST
jgi:ABC-type protease/lipase transport system fused ATPase/permease subunit